MLYTVDRVQFDKDGKLIFFEFYNVDSDKEQFQFVQQKYRDLLAIATSHECKLYGVRYNNNFRQAENIIVVANDSKQKYSFQDYSDWFKSVNNITNTSNSNSKSLGAATCNEGDPFIKKILNTLHEQDFSNDDNGLDLTKNALNGAATFGFDFDLFDNQNKTIIEFLKNDTASKEKNPISNVKAHPMRYSWITEEEQEKFKKDMLQKFPKWKNARKTDNRQKYISLWKSAQLLNGELYLVNYCDNYEEKVLSIIEVKEIDEHKGFMYDISYKLSYDQLIEWLKVMNTQPEQAKQILNELPKEERKNDFWNNYYSGANPVPNRSVLGKTLEDEGA